MVTPIRISDHTEASPLRDRPLLDDHEAAGVAALFKVLSGTTRLRLLHALTRADELRVSDLATAVDMSQQGVSNQLQRLVDQKILATRREGTSIYYRIVDPCVPRMLEFGLCLLESPGNACGQP